jgi:hypothetical protein
MKKLTYLELLQEIKKILGAKWVNHNGYYICSCATYILNMSDYSDLQSEYPEFYKWIMRIGKEYDKLYYWGSAWQIPMSQVLPIGETVLERKMKHLDNEILRVNEIELS